MVKATVKIPALTIQNVIHLFCSFTAYKDSTVFILEITPNKGTPKNSLAS